MEYGSLLDCEPVLFVIEPSVADSGQDGGAHLRESLHYLTVYKWFVEECDANTFDDCVKLLLRYSRVLEGIGYATCWVFLLYV